MPAAAEHERKRLEAQLRQAQKMEAIGTLAGGIAHDFNNILTAILGYTELALNDIRQDSAVRRYLQEVRKAGQRAKTLVQQILTFSRRTEQARTPVQLPRLVEEALALLRASLPSTIAIRHHISQDAGTVLADPTQLQQVLLNLCANAEYAMRETGGLLEIRGGGRASDGTASRVAGWTLRPHHRDRYRSWHDARRRGAHL